MRYTLVLAVLLLAGCSASAEPGPRFDDEGQAEITCMKHQPNAPGDQYLKEENWDTDMTLPLLRYYTTNGKKPYCDGQTASDVDKQWLDIYVKLGADTANIRI